MRPNGLTLTVKIFLSTAAVVVVIIGVTLAIAARQASRAADDSVNRVLGSARGAINAQLGGVAAGLTAAATTFCENAAFRSVVESRVSADVLDQAGVAANSLKAKWVQITDGAGLRLAKSDEPGADAVDMSGSAELRAALGGKPANGYGATRENELIQLVAVPILGGGKLVGAMLASRPINDAFAEQVKMSAAGLQIVFYTYNAEGAIIPAASTVGTGDDVVRALSSLPKAASDSVPSRVEVDLSGVHYVGLAESLSSTAGQKVGGYLMLRDRDAEFASFARLQQSLLLSGGVGIVVARHCSRCSIASQITRPVNKLVVATRRAADGDYLAEIPQTSNDEIGVLAGAFRGLLADLREKQELVAFLSSADTGKRDRARLDVCDERAARRRRWPHTRQHVRRALRDQGDPRRRRHGHRVQGRRHRARRGDRDQDAAAGLPLAGSDRARALQERDPPRAPHLAPQRRPHARPRRALGHLLHHDGVRRGEVAQGADHARAAGSRSRSRSRWASSSRARSRSRTSRA